MYTCIHTAEWTSIPHYFVRSILFSAGVFFLGARLTVVAIHGCCLDRYIIAEHISARL